MAVDQSSKPMIRRVEVKNFRSLAAVSVDLEDLTILVGPNGSGKSNFVAALQAAWRCVTHGDVNPYLSPPQCRWRGATEADAGVGVRLELRLDGRREGVYAFEVTDDETGPFVRREVCRVCASGGGEHVYDVREGVFVREVPGIRPKLRRNYLALPTLAATEEFGAVRDLITSMGFHHIDPRQIADPNSDPQPGRLTYDGGNAALVLHELQRSGSDDYRRLCHFLELIVPGIDAVYVEEVATGRLQFRQAAGGDLWVFDPWEVSDGTLGTLGVLLAIYQRGAPRFVAVEEPEATVHPAAAEIVFAALADGAYRRQVLVTTHSADILDLKEIGDQYLRVVEYEDGRTVMRPPGEAARSLVGDKLFTYGELLRDGELHPPDQRRDPPVDVDLFRDFE
jgi:predicted ATPase